MTPSLLIETIRAEFPMSHAPAPTPVTEPGCCAECDSLSSFLSQHSAMSLEALFLAQQPLEAGALDPSYLLTPESFHYFLPAYVLASLNSFVRSGDSSVLLQPTVSLAPGADHNERVREYRARFSPGQVGAIALYLSFCYSLLAADDSRGKALSHAIGAIWNSTGV